MHKVFSFNSELYKVTGVQKVLMDIHHAIQNDYEAKIVGTIPYEKVNANHNIAKKEYIRWNCNPFMFFNSIVFVHERKFLFFFWLLNHVLFQKIKIIYVHHNIFYNHRFFSIMPKVVVSISNRSTENLVNVFKVPKEHVHLIYNCVVDKKPGLHKKKEEKKISVLLPARINKQKRQIEIYQHLKGKLDSRITIKFAGDGPLFEDLKLLVKDDPQFECLGFREDVIELLQQSDYMMLFSNSEGLSITLIEAAMCGVPIITNDVGGNLEIAHHEENAFVVDEWDELVEVLNRLPDQGVEDYLNMSGNSRRIYETKFTFDKFKQRYLELVGNLMKTSQS